MTPEQIQSALSCLNNISGFEDEIETIRHVLTQALEIAKGEKVVVPREPNDKIQDGILNTGLVSEYAQGCDADKADKLYKAMIAVAEGE
jgi:hypothetical protein